MTKIINLTPHTINIVATNGEAIATFPSQGIARVASKEEIIGELNGIPVTSTTYGEIEGLPAESENTVFIVSRLILSALEKQNIIRHDLRVPGLQVRNEAGQVVGCKSLALN